MADLYSSLPTKSYTLGLFNQEAHRLHSNFHNENMEPFLRFVLTGDAGDHQVVIDPIQNALQGNDSISGSRDYDSAIGVMENIAVLSSISVYPVPNPADVLSTSIHLTATVREGEVSNILNREIAKANLNEEQERHTYPPHPEFSIWVLGSTPYDTHIVSSPRV